MKHQSTFVVTGATGGLGTVLTRTLLDNGDCVIAIGRSATKLEKLHEALDPQHQARLQRVVVDVTNEESVDKAFESFSNQTINGVAHTVGGYTGGTPIHKTPIADLDNMVALNIRSTFLILRASARALLSGNKPAGIVCVGSASGRSGAKGHLPYGSTKAAVHSMVRSAAADLAKDLIRVNAVLPGMIATPANLSAMPGADHSRWVTPQEIANTIAFLLSDDAIKVTGACIEMSGKSYTPD